MCAGREKILIVGHSSNRKQTVAPSCSPQSLPRDTQPTQLLSCSILVSLRSIESLASTLQAVFDKVQGNCQRPSIQSREMQLASTLQVVAGRPQPRRPRARPSRPAGRGPSQQAFSRPGSAEPSTGDKRKPGLGLEGLFSALSAFGLGDELVRQEAATISVMVLLSSAQLAAACNLSAQLQGARATPLFCSDAW